MSEIYCYTDGACGDYCAGIGYSLSGEVTVTGSRTIDENITSMEAELHAVLEAVRVASLESEDREMITIYTDCEPLVRKLGRSENARRDWEQYRQSAHWLFEKFDSWDMKYTSRDNTKEAHDLARAALQSGRNS